MKRINSKCHILHVLKTAETKLRKAIFSNCDREILNFICECVLNVLNGNFKLSDCVKPNLRKHTAILREVADERGPLFVKKKLIVQRGVFLLPLLTARLPTLISVIFRMRVK